MGIVELVNDACFQAAEDEFLPEPIQYLRDYIVTESDGKPAGKLNNDGLNTGNCRYQPVQPQQGEC